MSNSITNPTDAELAAIEDLEEVPAPAEFDEEDVSEIEAPF